LGETAYAEVKVAFFVEMLLAGKWRGLYHCKEYAPRNFNPNWGQKQQGNAYKESEDFAGLVHPE
jgi:hypothetical protein